MVMYAAVGVAGPYPMEIDTQPLSFKDEIPAQIFLAVGRLDDHEVGNIENLAVASLSLTQGRCCG
jgi:hypothetical protein